MQIVKQGKLANGRNMIQSNLVYSATQPRVQLYLFLLATLLKSTPNCSKLIGHEIGFSFSQKHFRRKNRKLNCLRSFFCFFGGERKKKNLSLFSVSAFPQSSFCSLGFDEILSNSKQEIKKCQHILSCKNI